LPAESQAGPSAELITVIGELVLDGDLELLHVHRDRVDRERGEHFPVDLVKCREGRCGDRDVQPVPAEKVDLSGEEILDGLLQGQL